jgi:RNA-binding protein 5/10
MCYYYNYYYFNKTQIEVTYTTPDVTAYTFDEASGYYYDSLTGFYYDSKTQYYYNPHTLKWMYWDAASMNYIPITDNQQQTSTAQTEPKTVEPTPKKAKVNTATEIAKVINVIYLFFWPLVLKFV